MASIRKIADKGNKVVFDGHESYIENKKTGIKTRMRPENGVYVFDVWVPMPGLENSELQAIRDNTGFTRQVR